MTLLTTNNQVKALKNLSGASWDIIKTYNNLIEFLKKEIKTLEKRLKELLETSFKKEYELLISIPGIGLKVSSMIISTFNSFRDFDNAKQACSFAGIAPNPYQSGTSVKGRGAISKRGNTFSRKILYMGALSAILHNSFIKGQYSRLLERGKSKMQAVIAAAHKLLRLAFGVLKSGEKFDKEYVREYR